ncbi:hypothetical protein D3C81_1268930 [compost metagenome]
MVAAQRGRAGAALAQIEQREGNVVRIGAQRAQAQRARFVPGTGIGGRRGQLAQQLQLALGHHALGVVAVGADDAARAAVIVGHRAVGEGVVGLLRVAVALHDQQLLLDETAFAALHGRVQHRPDLWPDLAPDALGRLPQRRRMLAADDRLVRVVVEEAEVGAPAHPDRLARGQHDADGRLQALRPGLGRAQRRARPVVRTDQRAHLAAPGEEGRGDALGMERRHVAHRVLHGASGFPHVSLSSLFWHAPHGALSACGRFYSLPGNTAPENHPCRPWTPRPPPT